MDSSVTVVSNIDVEVRAARTITFLVAPDVPTAELPALEAHYAELLADPDYALIVNYSMNVVPVYLDPDARLVVIAPDATPDSLTTLRNDIKSRNVIAVNYALQAFAFYPEG